MTDSETDPTTRDDCQTHCGSQQQNRDDKRTTDGWIDNEILETRLPERLRTALGAFVGREAVDTLGDFADEIRRLTGDGGIAVTDLCHANERTDHWGEAGDDRYYFRCFYDAVILATLVDRPVDVHTVSPDGVPINARALGSEKLTVTPEEAVFSFGIAADAGTQSGGEPTVEDGYAAICPYVRAFPDRGAYEQWAQQTSAPTVGMALADATAMATALTE